jgi:peptidyl-prolyl cis-trans isomerase B (cyclophilin B)
MRQGPSRSARRLLATIAVGIALAAVAVASRSIGPGAEGPSSSPPSSAAPFAASIVCASPPLPPTTHAILPAAPEGAVAQGAQWEVRVSTTCGELGLVLDGRAAPRSVASFVTLARAGYWSDSVCHRLTSRQAPTGFLQCGDPSGHGDADPGYELPLENVPADRTYRVGDVGMARGEGVAGTAGEFFVVHRNFTAPSGAQLYSLIGHVVSGQDVVQRVAARGGEDTRPDGPPFQSVSILSVEVVPQ